MSSDHNLVNGSKSMPALEDLIVQYGDSTNTTWIEDKFSVWRHENTGAAIGYALSEYSYCIIWGNPLCEKSQYTQVAGAFIEFCEKSGYKPVWVCVDEDMEKYLAKERGWRAVTCIQEDGLNPTKTDPEKSKEVRKHIRGAQKKGCVVIEVEGEPSDEIKNEIDRVIAEWKKNRNGTQIHMTNVEPWRDIEHRRYFYARDADGKVLNINSTCMRIYAPANLINH